MVCVFFAQQPHVVYDYSLACEWLKKKRIGFIDFLSLYSLVLNWHQFKMNEKCELVKNTTQYGLELDHCAMQIV